MDDGSWQEVPLRLESLRGDLVRQEVTILFAFIERAQFLRNEAIYREGAVPVEGFTGSFFDYMLSETERIHGLAGRYTSCDEHPFSVDPPSPIVRGPRYPEPIRPNAINANETIRARYLDTVVPALCRPGDDAHYGSSATCDVACLQALSRRIHFGKHVAEAKFQADRAGYTRVIEARDGAAIADRLVDRKVEQQVLERVREKAAMYGAESRGDDLAACKVSPDTAATLFETFIIPTTIQVEVDYLLERLA